MNVVFDFGVVLFTWQPARFLPDFFPARAATPALASALAADVFSHADWHAFDQGLLTDKETVIRTAERLGLDSAALTGLLARIPDLLTPVEGTVEILRGLYERRQHRDDIKLFFLSNMPTPFARELEQRHPFLNWFDGGIFSGDVNLIKPQPEIFRLMQQRFSLDPAQTLFIDDLQSNVDAARFFGWQAVQFVSSVKLQEHLTKALQGLSGVIPRQI